MKVRIIQLLCPQRHCIVAIAYESPNGEEIPENAQKLNDGLKSHGLNPWCGICGSKQLQCEDRATGFRTLQEAQPHLEANERAQAITREFFGKY